MIKNDKCKQSEVLAFWVQNLGLFVTFVIFYQIDWSLLFQAQYTSKMLGCMRSCKKKNSNLFDHHLHEIFGLHSGTDYQTRPNFPNTNLNIKQSEIRARKQTKIRKDLTGNQVWLGRPCGNPWQVWTRVLAWKQVSMRFLHQRLRNPSSRQGTVVCRRNGGCQSWCPGSPRSQTQVHHLP